jgi:DNA-binding transcriptional regulator YiaG
LEDLKKKVVVSDEAVKEFDKAFAIRMKKMREDRGLKRDWVAMKLGIHYNTLKNWELGKSHPGTREVLALCKIYHCKPGEFFKGIS